MRCFYSSEILQKWDTTKGYFTIIDFNLSGNVPPSENPTKNAVHVIIYQFIA